MEKFHKEILLNLPKQTGYYTDFFLTIKISNFSFQWYWRFLWSQ